MGAPVGPSSRTTFRLADTLKLEIQTKLLLLTGVVCSATSIPRFLTLPRFSLIVVISIL
jgi:hypothetical protein